MLVTSRKRVISNDVPSYYLRKKLFVITVVFPDIAIVLSTTETGKIIFSVESDYDIKKIVI